MVDDLWKASINYSAFLVSGAIILTTVVIFPIAVSLIISVVLAIYGVGVNAPWLEIIMIWAEAIIKATWLAILLFVVPQCVIVGAVNMLWGNR